MQNYEVKKNDTLWKIAKLKGRTVEQLARANNLKGKRIHFIREGQNLLIPDLERGEPDTTLAIKFRGLDHGTFTPRRVKVQHDNKVVERELDSGGILSLGVFDHANGLKIWIEDLSKQFVKVLDRPLLPVGNWRLSIDSRQIAAKGNLAPERGPSNSTTPAVKAAVTHNAQVTNGTTARSQARVDSGKPVHAIGSLYTEENLRLLPGNERYRKFIIAAAKRHGLTPQSLAALVHAEAAKDTDGVWLEDSNIRKPKLAQGLAQFFAPAWMDVFNYPDSLLHAECKGLGKTALLAKRHEAKYAIDGAASYAAINLKNFSRKMKIDISSIAPEDKAKLAYFLHHEGLLGALRVVGKEQELSSREAFDLLAAQFGGNTKRAAEWVRRYQNDAPKAYKAWLYSYIDAMINVKNFLVKDKEAFATPPQDMAHIIKRLGDGSLPGTPQPRTPAPAPAPAPAPPTQDVQRSSPGSAAQAGGWHDPLDVCTLRTAGLASVRSAKFGMTRNGGSRAHQGIDLIAAPGTPVYAVADGTVYLSKASAPGYAYGNTLILEVNIDDLPEPQARIFRKVNPGARTIGFFYAHLSEFCVRGGPVDCGAVIAKSGSSGNASKMTTISTGAHLHFEVRKEALARSTGLTNRTDPLPFLAACTNR